MAAPIVPRFVTKTGFISEFTIEVNENRDAAGRMTFFRFTLTDDIQGMFNPVTFVMSRDSHYDSDNPAIPWKGLPFSSVQVAAASALKDAYINRKRVLATGGWPQHKHIELFSVTLSERSGDYLYTVQAGSAVDVTGRPIARPRPRRATTTSRRRTTRR